MKRPKQTIRMVNLGKYPSKPIEKKRIYTQCERRQKRTEQK